MYKINDFSKISNTAITTLRYYDEIDLFKPNYTDIFTGYRYYLEEQLNTIKIINQLKEIDISLNDIKTYLENKNLDILLKQRELYQEKLKKIEEIINMKETNNYKIVEGDYKKYVEVNGTRNINNRQALEVRDDNARYYIINKNDNFYDDFVIYNENNWITLNRKEFVNEELINAIFNYLKEEGYEYLTNFVPVEDEEYQNELKNKYNISVEMIMQESYKYYKNTFTL